ncbi:tyrosine-protein phosphatase [Mycobacterium sp. NBC_00419]|uniref:tyrosine-protein phosphatase n=1 Tax=Mycobacterium sp. NBC_00419 TaxID=2975989 RepID=UPI002E246B10
MSGAQLSGAWNFRDVAESTGIRPGLFFRSSELSGLDDSGRDVLRGLGVTDVADLRSPIEVEKRGPGAVPDDVTVHLLPFPDLSHTPTAAPHETAWEKMMTEATPDDDVMAAGSKWMNDEYARFAKLAGARRAVRQVATLLADNRPVLVHCFAGKDRTGFSIAVVLESIGVPREAIMADFLRSNDAVGRLRDRILESVRKREGITPEVVAFAESRLPDGVLGVQEDYLVTARRVIDEEYGGLPGYLEAAEVTADDLARLRAVLLG